MSQLSPLDAGSSSHIDIARRIDEVCRRFEVEWRTKSVPPRIEEFLGDPASPNYLARFRELLAVELELRQSQGEAVGETDYSNRFPAHHELISEVFAAREPSTVNQCERWHAGT